MATSKKPNVLATQVGGDHYKKYPVQPIEYIMANGLDFAQGNIVKLATRFRDKGGAEDLHKVKQYADILLLEYGEDTQAPIAEVSVPIRTNTADGIYLYYEDGDALPFTGAEPKQGVKYIGVLFNGNSFAVALTESEDVQLLNDDQAPTERPEYYLNECDAIYDFNHEANTARLLQDNPALAGYLKEGEAIPTLGELVIMRHLRDEINAALEYVGGQPLTDKRYWSSAEYSTGGAWGVYFNSGYTNYSYKYSGYAVRAVAAF